MNKRSVAEVIILTLVTCGIYGLYWIYAFSNDIKTYLDDETINPGLELLLCIVTCGIYTIYWMYKFGKLICTCQEKAGVQVEDNSIIYLILAVFGLGIVNFGLMQNAMNIVIDASGEPA
ncbi:MAG: DUF4234 domain-containing protein [Clostridia bacterium]|nr:DUF4234 domain-containing protein [Clostridia bacterium]